MRLKIKNKKLVIFLIGLICLFLIFITYVLLGLPKPDNPEHSIFVYGTLRNEIIRNLVCLCDADYTPAVLSGYRKKGLNIIRDEAAEVTGKIIRVNDAQLKRFDEYEDVPSNYRRLEIEINDERHWVYVKKRVYLY